MFWSCKGEWCQLRHESCFNLTLLSLWLHLQRQNTVSLPIDDPLHEIISSLVSMRFERSDLTQNSLVSWSRQWYSLRIPWGKKYDNDCKPVVCWERADWGRKGLKPCHSHLHLNGILSNNGSLYIKQASYLCLALHAHLNKCLLCMLF